MQPFETPPIQAVPNTENVQVLSMQDGTHAVLFTIADVTGSKTMVWEPKHAEAVANMLLATARQASTGLVVATGELPRGDRLKILQRARDSG
jgi:hypothetical protein